MLESSHHGFTRSGRPFPPLISEGLFDNHAVVIRLPAHPDQDLKWTDEKKRAEECVSNGKEIFWQLDLGLELGALFLKEPSLFFSYGIALEQFTREIWGAFQDRTLGISLYRGMFDIPDRMFWDGKLDEHFSEYGENKLFARELFSANLFAEFLHRLISYLPVEIAPFCLFECQKEMNVSLAACLFSRARFEYVNLAIKGSLLPFRGLNWETGESLGGWIGEKESSLPQTAERSIGVLLPEDAFISLELFKWLERIFFNLKKSKTPFRIIPESLLIEEWDALATLIVFQGAVSSQGERMLKGFLAAGGEIINDFVG